MKRYPLLMILLATTPAVAATTPTPGKVDPHVCDVNYNENDVVHVVGKFGDNITIRFDPSEKIMDVPLSDNAHMEKAQGNGSNNVLYLKAKDATGMPVQPFSVRTQRADGKFRDYTFEWEATPLHGQGANTAGFMSAAAGQVKATEIMPPPPTPLNYCYLIRFNYPADLQAQQAAAWRARQAKDQADQAERELRDADALRARNHRYVAQGDVRLAPTEVYDDGNTTTLVFPGNQLIPTLFRETRSAK